MSLEDIVFLDEGFGSFQESTLMKKEMKMPSGI